MTATAQARMAAAPTARFGGFWIRVLAFLLDSIVIGCFIGLLSLGLTGLAAWDRWELAPWQHAVETLVGLAYFTVLWSWIGGGRTVGMRLLGLRVVGTDGRSISLGAAVIRWIGVVISAAVVLLGLAWVAFDPRKQGWHDKLSGTVVLHDAGGDVPVPTHEPTPDPVARDAVPARHPVARGLAVGSGLLGSSIACLGVALAVAGDAVVQPGPALVIVAIMTLVAIVGSVVAWWSAGIGAAVLFGAAVVFGLAVGPLLGPWYDGLLAATSAGPATETAYWFDAPATGLLLLAGTALGFGGLLAIAGVRRDDRAPA